MKQFKIDLHKGRIEFTDSRFYLSENGNYVPSVTTILEAYPKTAQFYSWLKEVGTNADEIRDEAGRRGSIVHELTERYDQGEEVSYLGDNGYPSFKMLEWSMFERYVDFVATVPHKVEMMEVHMIDEKLGFAGTVDRVIKTSGKTILLDIKTSNALHDSYWLQLSAYYQLLKCNSVFVDQVAILWLNAKTRTKKDNQGIGWQFIVKDTAEIEQDWELFQSTYKLWKAINKDVKPRNLSYSLKHKR